MKKNNFLRVAALSAAVLLPCAAALAEDYAVTFDNVDNGKITVINSHGKVITSGTTVAGGSAITIIAAPSTFAYKTSVAANGETLTEKETTTNTYVYSYTVNDATTITPTFTRKGYTAKSGNINGSNDPYRNIYSVIFKNSGKTTEYGRFSIDEIGSASYQRAIYQDKTDQTIKVPVNTELSVIATGTGTGMGLYLYVDLNNDETFKVDLDQTNYILNEGNELLTFNLDRWGVKSGTFYNSKHEATTNGNIFGKTTSSSDDDPANPLPNITLTKTGKYYARLKMDWNDTEPISGSVSIAGSHGEIVDFIIQVYDPAAEGEVNITQPEENDCSIKVINTSDSNSEVTNGTKLQSGQVLQIIPTVSEGYLLEDVIVDYVAVNANSEGNYYYTTTDENTNISVNLIDKSTYYVPVSVSSLSNGSLELQQNGATVSSVLYGSEVTVVPVPADDYYCTAVTANGNALTANEDGSYTYQVLEETTFAATFAQKWALNSAITSSTQTSGGTSGNNNRWITKITLKGDNLAEKTVETGATTYTHNAYVDKSSEVVKVKAGEKITLSQEGVGVGLGSYLYIDYDNDYIFEFPTDLASYQADHTGNIGCELVTFNSHKFGTNNYYDSNGSDKVNSLNPSPSAWNLNDASKYIPTFQIPNDLKVGKYRARFVCDWNNMSTSYIDPGRNGVILDFTIEVVDNNYNVVVSTPEKQSKLGSVSIEGVDGTTTTTDQAVTVVATPAKDVTNDNGKVRNVKFMCWTDAEGKILSDKTTYTYSSYDAANLVAHFGYQVNIVEVNNGGGTVTISKKSANAQSAPAYISDLDSTVTTYANDTDNQVSIVAASTFANVDDAAVSNGQGTVLEAGEEYVISAKSSDDAHTITTVYVRNETSQENEVAENYSEVSDTNISKTTEYTKTITLDDPYNVAVTFWAVNTGVEDVAVDGESAAEYFNLNGVRMDGDNLAPGVYIVRRGTTVTKQVIK